MSVIFRKLNNCGQLVLNLMASILTFLLFILLFCYLRIKHKLVLEPWNWAEEIRNLLSLLHVSTEILDKIWRLHYYWLIDYLQRPLLYVTFFRLFQFRCRLGKTKVLLQSVLYLLKDKNYFSLSELYFYDAFFL